MGYDEATDIYTCHAGKELHPLFLKKQKNKSGYESEVTVYEYEDCMGCPYKEKCTKAKGNKRLYISKNFLEKCQESYENILSEKRDPIQNESFDPGGRGIWRFEKRLWISKISTPRKTKVKLEILLLCMGYNLNKLHAKIQGNRTGTHLFEIKSA